MGLAVIIQPKRKAHLRELPPLLRVIRNDCPHRCATVLTRVQQALDIVRVIGNEAVHPGQIEVSDNPAIAASLFRLVNIIAEHMISEPKAIAELYRSLPPDKLKGIEDRDR